MRYIRYFKMDVSRKHKNKIVTIGYAFAILFAFFLSIINNSDVSASIPESNRFNYNYMVFESSVTNGIGNAETIYPESSIENIRSLYQVVSDYEREETIKETVTVKSGDTLISVLSSLGLARDVANDVYYEFKDYYDPKNLKAGHKFDVTKIVDKDTNELIELQEIIFEPTVGNRYVVALNDNNEYAVDFQKDETLTEVNGIKGSITGSVSVSMNKQGVSNGIIADFINIFSFSVDFRRDVRAGDDFEVVYENLITPSGELVKTGNILYASLTLRKEKIELYGFKDSKGSFDYYTPKGQALKKTLHRKPLAFQRARISSPYGRRRHPILKTIRIHWGVDYAAPRGTAVYAGGDGVVQVARYNGGYGNYIKIRHNSEYSTAYGHLNGYARGIRSGKRVKQGQIIGYVGSTGRSTGPHLHYEVIRYGKRVNPVTIKAATGENLKGRNLKNFKYQVATVQKTYKNMFANSDATKTVKK